MYYLIMPTFGLLLFFAVEGALQLRVYAMYGCSKKVAIVNGVLFVIQVGLMVSFTILDITNAQSECNQFVLVYLTNTR